MALRKYQYIAHCNILQHIAIYCNVCCLNDVNVQPLHHKNDWIPSNLDYTLEFLHFIRLYTVYILFYCQNTYSHVKCLYQNPIKYCNTAVYCNTLNTIRNMALTRIVSPLISSDLNTCHKKS